MDYDYTKLWAAIGVLLVTLMAAVLQPIIGGLVLLKLWGWFAVPIFALPALTLAKAIGVDLVVGYMTYFTVDVKAPERTGLETASHVASIVLFRPFIFLAVGWTVRHWV